MKNFTKFLGRNKSGMLKVLMVVVGMVWGMGVNGQTTIYSEDFSTNAGKGNNAGTTDVTGVTNWSISTTGVTAFSATEFFKVNNSRFEFYGNGATLLSTTACYWNAKTGSGIDISNYRDVSLSITLGGYNHSSCGVLAQVSYDNINYIDVGYITNSASSTTYTVSNLQGSTLYVRVLMWSGYSTGLQYLDNVTVTGKTGKTTQTFSSGATSITVPENVYNIGVYAWGAGGGGGVNNGGYNGGGGGGGGSKAVTSGGGGTAGGAGGSLAYSNVPTISGSTYNYTVGIGGPGGTIVGSTYNNGTQGGSSYFGNSSTGVSAGASVLAVGVLEIKQ